MATAPCEACGREVDPRTGYRAVHGYEPIRGRKQGGTNYVVMRETEDRYICADCLYDRQHGTAGQERLI